MHSQHTLPGLRMSLGSRVRLSMPITSRATGSFSSGQQLALHDADAMLRRDRAAQFRYHLMDGIVHFVPPGEERLRVGADRLADVVMNVAVAEMAERHRPAARDQRFDGLAGVMQEIRHRSDRDRDVVLDRAAFSLLRHRENLAQMPEGTAMLDTVGNCRIVHQTALHCGFQRLLERRPQIQPRRRCKFQQHVPRMLLVQGGSRTPWPCRSAKSTASRQMSSKLVAARLVLSCIRPSSLIAA